MDGLLKDIRYGFRSLLRRPAFTAIAVLTLALGIGANTAIFSVVNAVLLRALPFQSPEQLVSIKKSAKAGGFPGLAAYEYLAWRDHNKVFVDLAAYSDNNFNLTGRGEPERISCAQVTASIFPLLGVQPLLGRAFLPDEDRPDRDQAVVVSESFWHRRYGSDPAIIGSSITLNDEKYTVVGIMPASFRFPGEYEVWVPLALDAQAETSGDTFTLIDVVGRLKPGLEIQRGQAELRLISNQVADQSVTQGKERLPVAVLDIVPLQQQLVAGIRFTILILWGAVSLVLLIACANVASLMLSRTVSRQREMAVRSAVGARRWQLIRQLLSESVLLGLAGGLLGVLLASWSTSAIATLIPAEFSTSIHNFKGIRIDGQMLAFTVVVSVLTGIIFGLAPALTASRPDLVKALREGAGHSMTGFGWRSLRGWLVVAELALALVLLLGAGLMIRSFARLTTVDTGFKSENVLTLRINLPRSKYRQPFQTATFYKELSERVAALPGVQSAAAISHTPLNGFGQIGFFRIEGQQDPERKRDRMIPMGTITGDYFRALQIPLVSGRTYDERDTAGAAPVAIINQAFAHRFFPNDNALGKRISAGCDENLCRTIVGVVANVIQESLSDDVFPEIYLPYQQSPSNGMTLMVRTTVDPSNMIDSVRNQVLAIDKNQPVYDVKTLQQRMAEAVAGTRSLMLLFGSFAGLALVLATVGIYGVISYSVMQRTREIGVRMALGAQPRDVLKLVIGQGMILAVFGIGLGLAVAFALTRLLSSLLFGVSATDLVTFVSLSLLLGGVALLASYLPARRATKVDPLVALRYE